MLAKKNIEELTAAEMTADIEALERIRKLAEQKNLADQMLAAKYDGDVKFMRTHKRLRETPPPIAGDVVLHQVMIMILSKQIHIFLLKIPVPNLLP